MTDSSEEIKIPPEVTLKLEGMKISAKGTKGEIQRDFSHADNVEIRRIGDTLFIRGLSDRKRARSLIKTLRTQINNMILGVSRGFTYKLKMAHSHFPISVKVDKDKRLVQIDNFIGERYARTACIERNVDVTVKGDDVIVSGADKESVGQTSTNIRRACRIKEKDPRVFQDGIYLYETYCGDELVRKI